jgi:hypothetical protein
VERVQVIALAACMTALALFAAGVVVDGTAPDLSDRGSVAGAVADGVRSVRLWSSERESRRVPRPGAPGVQPPEPRRGRRVADGAVAADAAGGRLAGGPRREVRIGAGADGGEIDAGGLTGDLLAARAGTIPRAGGAGEPARHEVEVPEPDPADERRPDPGGVLLSIPLQGSLDPEQGGSPTETEGVIVDGRAVDFTEDARYTLPAGGHVDGEMGTIAFDLEPHWAGGDETNNSLLQIRDEHQWENNLQIVKNNNALRFIIIDSAGVETNVNIYIDSWQPNEPHRIVATWGEALMALYVDGEQVGQATLPNDLAFGDSTPIHVGSDFPGTQYRGANGRISNLTIYGRALGPAEVR